MPVIKPNNATINIMEFLSNTDPLGPSDIPHAHTNSMIGGNTNANAVEHNAPINDINRFSSGTSSDMTTKKLMIH